jgi:hypothetical protein
MALQNIRQKSAAGAAIIGLGALLVGCGTRDSGLNAAQIAGTPVGAPLAVSCEPNQRAVVRQVAVNGALQSQVQCESVFAAAGMTGSYGATAPVGYVPAPSVVPAGYGYAPAPALPTPVYGEGGPLENTRIVRTAYPQQVVVREPAAPRVTSYQRVPERVIVQKPKRSVKKSAIIIGSSAGVGAAIGAAAGGKKGAGLGALIGGGGAAVWDQITRRK